MKAAYICTLNLKHPSQNDTVLVSFFQIATSADAALQTSLEQIGNLPNVAQDWSIVGQNVSEVGREYIETAAIEVLGWAPQ